MKKLFSAADRYIAQMHWGDMALVKLCLCSMGLLLGLATPKKSRRWVALGAAVVFVSTYVPLILGFLPHLIRALQTSDDV